MGSYHDPQDRPAWVDEIDNPYLHGIYTPTIHETTAHDLEVVEGEIPAGLYGAYLRNGPNPVHAPKNHYELAASFLRKLIVADPKRRKHRARYVALRAVVRIQRGFRARHLRRRTQRRSEMGPLPAIRETSSIRDSSIRSMGDVEGDDTRPDLSGDSSGARLSLSAAAERIASSLSGGYQEYKE